MGEFESTPVSLGSGSVKRRYRWSDGTLHDEKEPAGE